jgi:hypothetical protein
MLRSAAAVIAGYFSMLLVVMAGTMALVKTMVPGGIAAIRQNPEVAAAITPTPKYLAMNLALSFVAALLGGWVTARIATHSAPVHLTALAVLVVAMGIGSAFAPGSKRQPSWYKIAIPVIGVAGVAASALLA